MEIDKTAIRQSVILFGIGAAIFLFIWISSCVMDSNREEQDRIALSLRAEAENAKVTKALGSKVVVETKLSEEDKCIKLAKEEFGWTTDENDGLLRYEFSRGRIYVYNGTLSIESDTLKSLGDSAKTRWHDHSTRALSFKRAGKYKESEYQDRLADAAYDEYNMFYHRVRSR